MCIHPASLLAIGCGPHHRLAQLLQLAALLQQLHSWRMFTKELIGREKWRQSYFETVNVQPLDMFRLFFTSIYAHVVGYC
jgi:hypothetical protein